MAGWVGLGRAKVVELDGNAVHTATATTTATAAAQCTHGFLIQLGHARHPYEKIGFGEGQNPYEKIGFGGMMTAFLMK